MTRWEHEDVMQVPSRCLQATYAMAPEERHHSGVCVRAFVEHGQGRR